MPPFWDNITHLFRKATLPDYQRALTEFSRSLTLIVDLEQLMENLVGKLREIAEIPRIIIFMRDAETGLFRAMDSRGISAEDKVWTITFRNEDKLVQWLSVNEMTLVLDEEPGVVKFFSEPERYILEQLDVKIIVPLLVMNHVKGMVFLGEKRDQKPFNSQEQELLTTLLSQSALAFENAILYQEQKQRFRKMFRADRLATIGQMAAGAAHEIRNPLTTIRSSMQYLQNKESDKQKLDVYEGLMSEVDRIDEIIRGLLSFSKPIEPQKESVEIHTLINQVITLVASTAKRNSVVIQFNPDKLGKVVLSADPGQLKQVFVNIVLNAVQAMPEGGKLLIDISGFSGSSATDPSICKISFADTGPGISESDLDQIFDPFFTTKKEGTGLGLSISYGIIKQHGGDISIESKTAGRQKGTRVTVSLPGLEQIT